MKIKILNLINIAIYLCIFMLPWSATSQSHYLLSSLKAEKSGNRVIINWSIKQGSTCVGINILRSNDSINYQEIGNIQGICGSPEFEQRYTFVDENPISNQTNYYKLELGFSGRTEPALKVEFIKLEDQESKVVPNPNHGFGKIYFYNPNNQKVKIYFNDINGKYVDVYETDQEQLIFDLTHENKNPVASNVPSNIYNYIIMNDEGVLVTKGHIIIMNR